MNEVRSVPINCDAGDRVADFVLGELCEGSAAAFVPDSDVGVGATGDNVPAFRRRGEKVGSGPTRGASQAPPVAERDKSACRTRTVGRSRLSRRRLRVCMELPRRARRSRRGNASLHPTNPKSMTRPRRPDK
eukprot:scaffold112844_cov27-Tisochrysis_lutea.AAC.5